MVEDSESSVDCSVVHDSASVIEAGGGAAFTDVVECVVWEVVGWSVRSSVVWVDRAA